MKRPARKPAIGKRHPDYQKWLEYFSTKALGRNYCAVFLSVPRQMRHRTKWVRAALVDWTILCRDKEVVARLLEVRPDSPGYLPPATEAWAQKAVQLLSAKIIGRESRRTRYNQDLGVCC
jgi:hypothetical protein